MPRLYVKKATVDKYFQEDLIWELEEFASNIVDSGFFPPEHLSEMFDTLRFKTKHRLVLLNIYLLGIWVQVLRGEVKRFNRF